MRMKHLDTLRAFAIGLVMVEHFGGKALNNNIPIGAGSVGVGLFFTLSGFLITGILMQSFDGAQSKAVAWRDFYVRRLLRLVPPYYAVIAALLVLGIGSIATSWMRPVVRLGPRLRNARSLNASAGGAAGPCARPDAVRRTITDR